MRVVTTCHAEGFRKYAFRVLEGWHRWPADTELWWYTEGFSLPEKRDGIVEIDSSKLADLSAFKERYGFYHAPNYLFDVVRFSNKVFAAIDALCDYKGIGVWMDADCVTKKEIPAGFIESHLSGAYMAMLKRRGMYTETGFWVVDCSHPEHQAFLDTWRKWYTTDAFKQLANWTDCETLDATVRLFEKDGRIKTVSMSGDFDKEMHPMAKIELGKYIDHTKGARKELGYSPECATST